MFEDHIQKFESFEEYKKRAAEQCIALSEETLRRNYEVTRLELEPSEELVRQNWLEFYLWIKEPSNPEYDPDCVEFAEEERKLVSQKYPQLWKRIQNSSREEFTEWFMNASWEEITPKDNKTST